MRLFQRLLCLPIIFLLSMEAAAQSFQMNIGFGILALKGYMLQSYNENHEFRYIYERKSFGQGLNTELISTYHFSDQLSLESGFLLINSTFSQISRFSPGGITEASVQQISATSLNGIIGGRYLVPVKKGSIYFSLGGIIGVRNTLDFIHETYDAGGTLLSNSRNVFSGGFATGYYSRIGYNHFFSGPLSICMEVKFQSLTFVPGRSDLVESTVSGEDLIPSLNTNQKSVLYKKHYNDVDQGNPSMPAKWNRVYFPYSAMVLSFGFQFQIVK